MLEINATFIIAMISFAVFMGIMYAILYKPITEIIEARAKFFNENEQKQLKTREKIEILLNDKTENIQKSKREASDFLTCQTKEIQQNFENIIKNAKNEKQKEFSEVKNQLEIEKNAAKTELESNYEEFADDILKKVLLKEGK